MPTPRQKTNALATPLRRNAEGTILCRQCGLPVPGWSRHENYCSPACLDQWCCETNPEYFREKCLSLYGLRCAACGVTDAELAEQERVRRGRLAGGLRPPIRVTWYVDHIVPLWNDGANDVRNGQVLCGKCHQAKTDSEAQERAYLCRAPHRRAILMLLAKPENLSGLPVGVIRKTLNIGQHLLRSTLDDLITDCLIIRLAARGHYQITDAGAVEVLFAND